MLSEIYCRLSDFTIYPHLISTEKHIRTNLFFSEEYYENLLEHYFDPSNSKIPVPKHYVPFVSCLLTREQRAVIGNHIYSQTGSERQTMNPYFFKRIFCRSVDGFEQAIFKDKCIGKGATVFVIRAKDTGEILGGYNPLSWQRSKVWFDTNDSFIFAITKKVVKTEEGIPSLSCEPVISSVKRFNRAIYNGFDISESCFQFGRDLKVCICDKFVYKHSTCEKRLLNDCVAEIDEFEVFQLVSRKEDIS